MSLIEHKIGTVITDYYTGYNCTKRKIVFYKKEYLHPCNAKHPDYATVGYEKEAIEVLPEDIPEEFLREENK